MALRKNCGGPRKAKIKLTGSSCLKRCCSQASLDAQNETKLNVACVASVSSLGSSRKLGQEQKKMNDGGGGGE